MNDTNSTGDFVPKAKDLYLLPPPIWMCITAGAICVPVTILGGIGNLVILLAFALERNLLWKKHNIYLFALAITDLLTCVVSVPMFLDQHCTGRWRYTRVWCRIYQTLLGSMFSASLNYVVLIARDRMLMVSKGATYDLYESTKRKWLYAMMNIFGIPILMIPLHSYDMFTGVSYYNYSGRCANEAVQNTIVLAINFITFSSLPYGFMLYYYASVRRYFKKRQIVPVSLTVPAIVVIGGTGMQAVATQPYNNTFGDNNAAAIAALEKSKQAIKIVNNLLLSAFQSSWPLFLTVILNYILLSFRPTTETLNWWLDVFDIIVAWMFTANAANPFLYAYAMPAYREAVRNVGRKVLRCVSFKKCPLFKVAGATGPQLPLE